MFEIDGRRLTVQLFQDHVDKIEFRPWRPSGIMVHNTGAPTLAQWMAYDNDKRLQNLRRWYAVENGWPSGPHLFIDNDDICLFTPLNKKGTHSPSFNGTHIGIECVGDYDKEDDDKGVGLEMKKLLIAALGILHGRLGIDPALLKMHKDDPRTTHDCPGKDLYEDRRQVIEMTREWMGHGGEHPTVIKIDDAPTAPPPTWTGITNEKDLNLRREATAGSESKGKLPAGTVLIVSGKVMNGKTPWLRVKTPAGYDGWVAARFVDRSTA